MVQPVRPIDSPNEILAVLLEHPAVHVYGIADVEQLWERSRWFRRGRALAGLLDLPGSEVPVVYAVSADADEPTRALLEDLADELPPRFVMHAPRDAERRLEHRGYATVWQHDYGKMHLASPEHLPPSDLRIRTLSRDDLDELERLYASDERAGDFFHAGLLDTGWYLGLDADDGLAAVAGIHVVSPAHRVAAVANVATSPAHRRRGAARTVVATLCHRLLRTVGTIGLNVRDDNPAAAALYLGLGFERVVDYEEAELERR